MASNLAYLEVIDSKGKRKVPLPSGPLSIGRNITNLLVIDEPLASRFHCVIERTADGYRLRDLGSSNGTVVNGKAVKESPLEDGDRITIGATDMRLMGTGISSSAMRGMDPPELDALDDQAPAGLDLDAADVPEPAPAALGPLKFETRAPDWEQLLRDRAASLVPKPFRETDIAIINARGQVAHAPQPTATKTSPGSEALVMFRLILLVCFRSRATDIHVETRQDDVQIRIRVDGVMVELLHLYGQQKELAVRLLSMVKVISEIDIAQRNIVQEGSFSARVPSGKPGQPLRRVDYRVSFAPAVYGQKLVIRILDTENSPQHIDDLHLPTTIGDQVRRMILNEAGMILVCGPTGSGKTTTLYAVLRDIDVSERNVTTIEDPVEIQIGGVTQMQVNEPQGNTFSALLKSILRQDPDIILVGEIRDAETARTAVQAAMTGHLVFSTVHARDAVSAVYRILDLGVEPYLVSSGLQMVLAQRLVRKLCVHCKKAAKPTRAQIARMNEFGIFSVSEIFNAGGCRRCLNTGYMGRQSIVELLVFNRALREVVLKTPTMQDILRTLDQENFIRLAKSGFQLVADGITSYDEAERAVS